MVAGLVGWVALTMAAALVEGSGSSPVWSWVAFFSFVTFLLLLAIKSLS